MPYQNKYDGKKDKMTRNVGGPRAESKTEVIPAHVICYEYRSALIPPDRMTL